MTAPKEITREQMTAALEVLGFTAEDHVSEVHIDFNDDGLYEIRVTTHELAPFREVRYGYRLRRKSPADLAHQVVTGRST